MSLGGDIAATLPFLRSQAESMMVSSCTITRAGTRSVLNEETLAYEAERIAVYSGPCRFKFGATQANVVDAQAQLVTEQGATLSLPVDGSGGVTTDDVAEITSNPYDPALVGKSVRITGQHVQTFATARRFGIELLS